MDDISAGDLKTILHSKRANIYYLQHCRVLVNGGRVEYVTDAGKQSLYWNIPIANTTTILLGTGTSVTQAAMRELAQELDMPLEACAKRFGTVSLPANDRGWRFHSALGFAKRK